MTLSERLLPLMIGKKISCIINLQEIYMPKFAENLKYGKSKLREIKTKMNTACAL